MAAEWHVVFLMRAVSTFYWDVTALFQMICLQIRRCFIERLLHFSLTLREKTKSGDSWWGKQSEGASGGILRNGSDVLKSIWRQLVWGRKAV